MKISINEVSVILAKKSEKRKKPSTLNLQCTDFSIMEQFLHCDIYVATELLS